MRTGLEWAGWKHTDLNRDSPDAPTRTLQRLRSLGQANEIRTARAALKTELASGRAQIEDVLARPPACAMTAKVSELLPAWGQREQPTLLHAAKSHTERRQ